LVAVDGSRVAPSVPPFGRKPLFVLPPVWFGLKFEEMNGVRVGVTRLPATMPPAMPSSIKEPAQAG